MYSQFSQDPVILEQDTLWIMNGQWSGQIATKQLEKGGRQLFTQLFPFPQSGRMSGDNLKGLDPLR